LFGIRGSANLIRPIVGKPKANFSWFGSLFTIDPNPEAIVHAPLVHQGRGLILLLIIGVWPYTRLAGIFAGPVVRLILRVLPHRTRRFDGAITGA